MKQLTRSGAATGGRRRFPALHPRDARVGDELELIASIRRADPPAPGSTRPVIRPIGPDDGPALSEMALRCSPDTLRRRFHGPVPSAPTHRVVQLLTGPTAVEHLVAEVDGAIVGIATLHRSLRRSGDGEIAVLVEDAWQGTGLGHRLTGHLLRRARELGVEVVVAEVMREPAFVLDRLTHGVERSSVQFDGPIATVRIPMAAAGPGSSAT